MQLTSLSSSSSSNFDLLGITVVVGGDDGGVLSSSSSSNPVSMCPHMVRVPKGQSPRPRGSNHSPHVFGGAMFVWCDDMLPLRVLLKRLFAVFNQVPELMRRYGTEKEVLRYLSKLSVWVLTVRAGLVGGAPAAAGILIPKAPFICESLVLVQLRSLSPVSKFSPNFPNRVPYCFLQNLPPALCVSWEGECGSYREQRRRQEVQSKLLAPLRSRAPSVL